jgi:hypothetical protein
MATFYCLRFEISLNLEGQVPVFISLRKRVAQLYPYALCSLFIASYDLQGYGGGIRPRLHAGLSLLASVVLLIIRLHRSNRKHRYQNYLYCCMRELVY